MSDVNDEAADAQTARVRAIATKWATTMGLGGWSIRHDFYRAGWHMDRNPRLWSAAAAETYADFKYKQARIKWNLEEIFDKDDTELERLVIHEFTHCITDEFKQHAMQEMGSEPMHHASMERQVTELELAIWWAYEMGRDETKPPVPETGE